MAEYCYASLGSHLEEARQHHSHGERGTAIWSSYPGELPFGAVIPQGIRCYYEESS